MVIAYSISYEGALEHLLQSLRKGHSLLGKRTGFRLRCDCRASKKDFEAICGLETNGEMIYKNFGVTVSTERVADGFPHFRDTALPVLREYFFKGYTFE